MMLKHLLENTGEKEMYKFDLLPPPPPSEPIGTPIGRTVTPIGKTVSPIKIDLIGKTIIPRAIAQPSQSLTSSIELETESKSSNVINKLIEKNLSLKKQSLLPKEQEAGINNTKKIRKSVTSSIELETESKSSNVINELIEKNLALKKQSLSTKKNQQEATNKNTKKICKSVTSAIKLETESESSNVRNKLIEKNLSLKKQSLLPKKKQQEARIKNGQNIRKSGKMGFERLENLEPQKTAIIPDIDYEKLAAAQLTCSDITDPKYKKPFDYGWRRELVFRATVHENNPSSIGDVYYYTPDGFRLRSMVELAQVELEKGLTLDNFSFFPEATGVNNLWKETIRAAVFRDKESVAQTRQNVRQRLKNVKRKLDLNQPPRRRVKRRRNVQTYYERNNSEVDEMADEMLMALRHVKTEKDRDCSPDSRIVIDYDCSLPIKLEKEFSSPIHHDKTAKVVEIGKDVTKSQETLEEREPNRPPEVLQKEKGETQFQECRVEQEPNRLPEITSDDEMADEILMAFRYLNTEKDRDYSPDSSIVIDYDCGLPIKLEKEFSSPIQHDKTAKVVNMGRDATKLQETLVERESNRLPEVLQKEKGETQFQERREEQEPNSLPEITITNVETQLHDFQEKHDSDRLPEIIIKKEKDETQLQECLEKLESNKVPEMERNGIGETELQEHLEERVSNGQLEKNKTVSTSNKAVQTLPIDQSKDQAMLIERLQMENMFLNEKLADLEKRLNSNQVSMVAVNKTTSNDSSGSGNLMMSKTTEAVESDSDCEVICVDQVVMEYESICIDSD